MVLVHMSLFGQNDRVFVYKIEFVLPEIDILQYADMVSVYYRYEMGVDN
jgi:hypothetical protein